MNKRGLVLVLLLAVVVSTTVIAEDNHVVVPLNLSLVPAISFGQAAGYKTVNIVQLNVVAGYADVLRGAALGVVSIIGEDAGGVQAGVANWVSGDLTGVQAGVVNTVFGTADGAPGWGAQLCKEHALCPGRGAEYQQERQRRSTGCGQYRGRK